MEIRIIIYCYRRAACHSCRWLSASV